MSPVRLRWYIFKMSVGICGENRNTRDQVTKVLACLVGTGKECPFTAFSTICLLVLPTSLASHLKGSSLPILKDRLKWFIFSWKDWSCLWSFIWNCFSLNDVRHPRVLFSTTNEEYRELFMSCFCSYLNYLWWLCHLRINAMDICLSFLSLIINV